LNIKIGFYGFFWRFWTATQVYIIHKVAPRMSLCDLDREFGSCILTYREHLNFQRNYLTRTAIGFRASREH